MSIVKVKTLVMLEGVSEFLQFLLGLINAKTYCYYTVDIPVRICSLDRDLCRDFVIPRFTVFRGVMTEYKESYVLDDGRVMHVSFEIKTLSPHDWIIPEEYKYFVKALLKVDPVKLTGYLRKLREVWGRVSIDEYDDYLRNYDPRLFIMVSFIPLEYMRVVDLDGVSVPVTTINVTVYDYTMNSGKEVLSKTYEVPGQPYGILAEQVFEDIYDALEKGDYLFKKVFPELW